MFILSYVRTKNRVTLAFDDEEEFIQELNGAVASRWCTSIYVGTAREVKHVDIAELVDGVANNAG